MTKEETAETECAIVRGKELFCQVIRIGPTVFSCH